MSPQPSVAGTSNCWSKHYRHDTTNFNDKNDDDDDDGDGDGDGDDTCTM